MTVSRIPNVEGGIQPTIVTAKGDLIAAVANANPARLGVGSDGQLLTADSTASTGLSYQNNFAAGKNKIINGDFGVWQRGTSFTVATAGGAYTADRMLCVNESGANATFSQQTFTPGTAPVSGYEGTYFLRAVTTGTSGATYITQRIEDVRAFAGQTVTVSYWAKCASGTVSSTGYYLQNFGSGGSSSVFATLSNATITTSWQRFTHTIAIPSIASKTIGTSSYLEFQILRYTAAATVDLWGVQVEQGSTATAFQTATGTIQGELAACQRYFIRWGNNPTLLTNGYNRLTMAAPATSATLLYALIILAIPLRIPPASVGWSGVKVQDGTNFLTVSNITIDQSGNQCISLNVTTTGMTQYRPYCLIQDNNGANYLELSAEL